MEDFISGLKTLPDLTTTGIGVNPDAAPLVYRGPAILAPVPGFQWVGKISNANAVIRLPQPDVWNGKLMIGGTGGVRNEFSLDVLLSDVVLQHGYAFASCDKGTPALTLRDPSRSMAEWESYHSQLTMHAKDLVRHLYGMHPTRTYMAGLSNGGYATRLMLERQPELFDGGVDWEGILWHPETSNLLTYLPAYLRHFPILRNWRGDRTDSEQNRAREKMWEAGLHPLSEPFWSQYFSMYWVATLWIYGRNLDPQWEPFTREWTHDWLRDPSVLADYPHEERRAAWLDSHPELFNTGKLGKPLLSVAGNWDCLVPFRDHAGAYANLVQRVGSGDLHRLYEIDRGNHTDGLLLQARGDQQPVAPFFEASIYHLEAWVEQGVQPPASGQYDRIKEFSGNFGLLTESE